MPTNPAAFFTDPEAKALFKQRLRYLVARYGAYRNLLAWELFNEVQFVGSAPCNPYNSARSGTTSSPGTPRWPPTCAPSTRTTT